MAKPELCVPTVILLAPILVQLSKVDRERATAALADLVLSRIEQARTLP